MYGPIEWVLWIVCGMSDKCLTSSGSRRSTHHPHTIPPTSDPLPPLPPQSRDHPPRPTSTRSSYHDLVAPPRVRCGSACALALPRRDGTSPWRLVLHERPRFLVGRAHIASVSESLASALGMARVCCAIRGSRFDPGAVEARPSEEPERVGCKERTVSRRMKAMA